MANVESCKPEGLVTKVRPREPERLVNMVKPCPRPLCGSTNTTWRYYNNGKRSQPRYLCKHCKKTFTFGGKIQLTQQEQDAVREMAEEKATKVLKIAMKPGNLSPEQKATKKAAKKKLEAKKAARMKSAAKKAAQKEEVQASNLLLEISGDGVDGPEVKPKYKSVQFDL